MFVDDVWPIEGSKRECVVFMARPHEQRKHARAAMIIAVVVAIFFGVVVLAGAFLLRSPFARLNACGPISLLGNGGMPGYGLIFFHSKIRDEDLLLIQKMEPPNRVHMIGLSHTKITDLGLRHLRPLTNVQ